jgi:hypothetical protein
LLTLEVWNERIQTTRRCAMPKWIIATWNWLVLHREWFFGAGTATFFAAVLGVVKWVYEVREIRRKNKEREFEERKKDVLRFLRRQGAYSTWEVRTASRIAVGLKLEEKEVESLLQSLEDESKVLFCVGDLSGWYLTEEPRPPS